MRAFSPLAAACALVLALQVTTDAQGPARGTSPAPRRPAAPATSRGGRQAPPVEAPQPFQVGETLTFDVAWSNYLVAGSAVSRVIEKRPSSNSSAYYIVAEGRPLPLIARIYALYYKMDTLLDSFTTLSQRSTLYAEEGSHKRSAVTTFDRKSQRAQFELQTDTLVKADFAVPPTVQDGLATLYALRGRNFKAGDHLTIPVADEGTLYTATFDVSGPAPIKVPLGQMDAWNLRITITDQANQPVAKNVAAWISADPRRLPLKLQADLPVGSFALALRTAQ